MPEITNEVKRLNLDHLDATSHDDKYEVCKCSAAGVPHVHAKEGVFSLEHYNYHLGDTKEQYREEVRKAEEEASKKAALANSGMDDEDYAAYQEWKKSRQGPQKPAGMSDAEWAELQEYRASKAQSGATA